MSSSILPLAISYQLFLIFQPRYTNQYIGEYHNPLFIVLITISLPLFYNFFLILTLLLLYY